MLHTVGYDGRPVLYRASIAEMIVPYADPKASSYRKNVFDLGEYGVGMMANSLALGCDCLGTIRYFDGHMADSHGRVVTIKNAICLHEEDFGMLWKHTDWRTNQSEVRRSRRLAVSMIATVGNYDYGFYWYFYQDGTIQMEVKLTGIMNTTALKPGEAARYGTEVAPRAERPVSSALLQRPARPRRRRRGEHGPGGQHASVPAGPENPHDNAFFAEVTPLLKESAAQRNTNPALGAVLAGRQRRAQERLGQPVAYRLCPGETTLPFAQPGAAVLKRAAFLTQQPLGDAVRSPGAVPGRRLSQPEPRRRRPAAMDEGRPRPRRPRPGRLVHLRPDPHPPARGLAGDAGLLGRLPAPARRLLRPQPGARPAAAVAVNPCTGGKVNSRPSLVSADAIRPIVAYLCCPQERSDDPRDAEAPAVELIYHCPREPVTTVSDCLAVLVRQNLAKRFPLGRRDASRSSQILHLLPASLHHLPLARIVGVPDDQPRSLQQACKTRHVIHGSGSTSSVIVRMH